LSYSQIKDVLKTADFETIENIQQAKEYSKNWIYHNLKNISDLERYAKFKGYHNNWVKHQLKLRENIN